MKVEEERLEEKRKENRREQKRIEQKRRERRNIRSSEEKGNRKGEKNFKFKY